MDNCHGGACPRGARAVVRSRSCTCGAWLRARRRVYAVSDDVAGVLRSPAGKARAMAYLPRRILPVLLGLTLAGASLRLTACFVNPTPTNPHDQPDGDPPPDPPDGS